MGKATKKSMKKFASSGQLKKTIEARKKHQQVKKKMQSRRGNKGRPAVPEPENDEEEDEEDEVEDEPVGKKSAYLASNATNLTSILNRKDMTVDDLLGGAFMDDSDEDMDDDEQVSQNRLNVCSTNHRIRLPLMTTKRAKRTLTTMLPSVRWTI